MRLIFQNRLHSIKISGMHKYLYTAILLSTMFCLRGFSQASPPTLVSYADSVGSDSAVLYIRYTANDTGKVWAQVQLQQGVGNNVYDSTFTLPASDTGYAQLTLSPLTPCTTYSLLFNMRNDSAQGIVINPLVTFTTLCTSGITSINENTYSLIAHAQSVEVLADEVPQNAFVEIYDLTGRLISNTHFNQSMQQIPFNQNAGIYLLRITGNGQSLYTNRFMIY
jgi:hypothetical protein